MSTTLHGIDHTRHPCIEIEPNSWMPADTLHDWHECLLHTFAAQFLDAIPSLALTPVPQKVSLLAVRISDQLLGVDFLKSEREPFQSVGDFMTCSSRFLGGVIMDFIMSNIL